jgi:hypothetical protein
MTLVELVYVTSELILTVPFGPPFPVTGFVVDTWHVDALLFADDPPLSTTVLMMV